MTQVQPSCTTVVNAVIEDALSLAGVPRVSGPRVVKSMVHVLGSSTTIGGAVGVGDGVGVGDAAANGAVAAGVSLGDAARVGLDPASVGASAFVQPARNRTPTAAGTAMRNTRIDDQAFNMGFPQ